MLQEKFLMLLTSEAVHSGDVLPFSRAPDPIMLYLHLGFSTLDTNMHLPRNFSGCCYAVPYFIYVRISLMCSALTYLTPWCSVFNPTTLFGSVQIGSTLMQTYSCFFKENVSKRDKLYDRKGSKGHRP